jgi:cellulose biosynthesis protein BcsQ
MIVTIAGTKGGSGKTTTAVCLALEALEQGEDVVLIDLDPQGTATEWAPSITKHLPAVRTPAELKTTAGGCSLAFVDTPPGAATQATIAIEAADVVVAVSGLGPGDMRGLQHLLRMVDPDLIVPTRRDGRRILHGYALEALAARWPSIITDAVPSSAAVERAQADQAVLPILSPPAIAYRTILARVLELRDRKLANGDA